MDDLTVLPVDIDSNLKDQIRAAFDNAVDDIGFYEYAYIKNKMAAKLSVISNVPLPWVSKLACYYEACFGLLDRNVPVAMELTSEGVRLLGAALFYFINPYDVIPDMTPEIGYADDYYVFVLSIKALCKSDRDVVLGVFSQECSA
ncbi:MAG: DUF1232 domain-containing protein [Kiritimatiellaeota bacterium]|nr:DUF1232 domain-containing protein [Kiritimatiellota bacterium]